MKEISQGIFLDSGHIYTKNLTPGKKFYDERTKNFGSTEYREWNPSKSKLGAAIAKKIKEIPIKNNSIILYLGASTGTTVSHISDITTQGLVYAIEFSERVFRNLMTLSEKRKNVMPIFADARKTEDYTWVEEVDLVFCDIADPEQTDIAIRNAQIFLKKDGYLMISIKSQSIDVTKKPQEVYDKEAEKIKKAGFDIIDIKNLEPLEKDHCIILSKKR